MIATPRSSRTYGEKRHLQKYFSLRQGVTKFNFESFLEKAAFELDLFSKLMKREKWSVGFKEHLTFLSVGKVELCGPWKYFPSICIKFVISLFLSAGGGCL